MRAFSTIALFRTLASLLQTSAASNSGGDCVCTSDQPCWPSAVTFAQLQSQVSQPLVYPHPSASECYPPSDPSGNCADVINNWYNGTWRSSRPGSMEMANFETYMFQNGTIEACFLNTSITGVCEQGQVPVIGVDARSMTDIQAAIGFALAHRLRLVVKNTGHDYIARSTARGAFVLWTHNMKNITYDTAFVPQGGPGNETFQAVTLGAGVQWAEAYSVVAAQGRMMVGGISPSGSVGAAGGWLAGGGHSFLSPTHGLGVDNALEISIVLSTGQFLVTNAYQNSDLFWALRGGGGGTYGVVTSVTYRTFPQTSIQAWEFQANVTNSSALQELVGGFLRYQTQLTDDGWGGYGQISDQGIMFIYFAPNMTNETVATTTHGWLNFTQSLAPYGVVTTSQILYAPTWYEVVYGLMYSNTTLVGGYALISSRMLSRDTVANRYADVARVLIDCGAGFNTVAGGKVSQFAADSAGLNPAWRNAVIETICGVSWDEMSSSTDIRGAIEQLKGWIQTVYDLTPNDCAYLNEASPYEIDSQKTFFGSHYSTLKSIKDKYDIYQLFVVTEGVGSEDWNKDLTCRYGS